MHTETMQALQCWHLPLQAGAQAGGVCSVGGLGLRGAPNSFCTPSVTLSKASCWGHLRLPRICERQPRSGRGLGVHSTTEYAPCKP